MSELPTKNVWFKDTGAGPVRINEADFNPDIHSEVAPGSKAAKGAAPVSIADLKVPEAVELVGKAETDEALDELEAVESGRTGGGRKGVLDAIEARRDELEK